MVKVAWVALLLASAALILAFASFGESRDTYGELDAAVAKYNDLVGDMNAAVEGFNEVAGLYEAQREDFNAAVAAYNGVIESYQEQLEWWDRFRAEVERDLGHSL